MKKLLLLALVVCGGVLNASAENVTIYLNATTNSNWTSDGARFALATYNESGQTGWVSFTSTPDNNGYYTAEVSTDNTKFILCRMNGNNAENNWNNKYNQTPSSGFIFFSKDSYLSLTDTGWDNASFTISLLPWKYYFLGNWTNGNDNWFAGDELTEDNGSYKGTLTGKCDKYFGIVKGEHVNAQTNQLWNVDSWANVYRPEDSGLVDFASCEGTTTTGGNNSWHISSSNEGDIEFSLTSNAYSIKCKKTASIGSVGYMTYSNGEMCTISGASAYIVSANSENSVTLTEMGAETIWPVDEGMILKGSSGAEVTISSVSSNASATTIGTNYLIGTGNTAQNVTATDNTYVFANDDTFGVGFYKASESGELAAHKAYLNLERSAFSARNFLSFTYNDETEINEVNTVDNKEEIWNLLGVRQSKLQKGLNIMNGKKVFVK